MAYDRLVFRVHAIRRMFEPRISEEDVRYALAHGEVIEIYPDDTPYPSHLTLGLCGSMYIHVVAADHHLEYETIIITAYDPDPAHWDSTFRRRKALCST